MAKQGHTLKKFKDSEQLFGEVGLSKLTVYFKKNLYKLTSNRPVLGRSTLSSHFLKNNFRLIKSICRENFIYKYFTYKFKCKG